MANPTAFSGPLKNPGSGSPAICPMETYISGIRNRKERIIRFFISCICFSTGDSPGSAASARDVFVSETFWVFSAAL